LLHLNIPEFGEEMVGNTVPLRQYRKHIPNLVKVWPKSNTVQPVVFPPVCIAEEGAGSTNHSDVCVLPGRERSDASLQAPLFYHSLFTIEQGDVSFLVFYVTFTLVEYRYTCRILLYDQRGISNDIGL